MTELTFSLIRSIKGMTHKEFAEALGVSTGLINAIETKSTKVGVSKRTKQRLMNVFNLSEEKIMRLQHTAEDINE